jgi:hypothetical protein
VVFWVIAKFEVIKARHGREMILMESRMTALSIQRSFTALFILSICSLVYQLSVAPYMLIQDQQYHGKMNKNPLPHV